MSIRPLQLAIACLSGMVLLFQACKHEPQLEPLVPLPGNGGNGGGQGACDPDTVYFQQQVLPILVSNCSQPGCHNSIDMANDLDLTIYQSMIDEDVVRPFDLDRKLFRAITEDDPDKIMPPPPNTPLSQQQIGLIAAWIMQGALNNSCEQAGCDTLNVTYSGTIVPLVQQKCIGCHSGPEPQGGLDFNSWSALNTVAQDGRLNAAITHDPFGVPMPPNSPKLPLCDIRKFQLWIEAGAPNN